MTPKQQKAAIDILKRLVNEADEQNPGVCGYDDHEDTLEIRLLLIEIGALSDRRKGK